MLNNFPSTKNRNALKIKNLFQNICRQPGNFSVHAQLSADIAGKCAAPATTVRPIQNSRESPTATPTEVGVQNLCLSRIPAPAQLKDSGLRIQYGVATRAPLVMPESRKIKERMRLYFPPIRYLLPTGDGANWRMRV